MSHLAKKQASDRSTDLSEMSGKTTLLREKFNRGSISQNILLALPSSGGH